MANPSKNKPTTPKKEAKPAKGSLDEVAQSTSTDALILALRYASSLVPSVSATIGDDGTGNLFVYVTDGSAAVRVAVKDPGFTVDTPFTVEIDTLRKALAKRVKAKVRVEKGVLTVTDTKYKAELTVEDAVGDFTMNPPNKDQIVTQLKMTADLWQWLQMVTSKLSIVDLNLGIEPLFFCRVNDKVAVAASLDDTQVSFAAVKSSAVGDVPSGGVQFMLPNNFFGRLIKSVPYDSTSLVITDASVYLTMRNLKAQLALTAAEANIRPEDVMHQVKALPSVDGADVELDAETLGAFIENSNALSMSGERVVKFTKSTDGANAVCSAANGNVKAHVTGSCPVNFAIDLKLLMGIPRQGNTIRLRVSADGNVAVAKVAGNLPYYYVTTLVSA